MYTFCYYFLMFIIFSMLGWIVECISVFMNTGKLTNRGFLIGPYLPIYGVAAMIMIFSLSNFKDHILLLFILSMLLCSFIEYFTSYFMEKLFKARWWDYSNRKFNLQGRVCLKNAIAFGIMGVLLIQYMNGWVTSFLDQFPKQALIYISLTFFFVFMVDLCLSFCVMSKIKETITSVVKEDSSIEMTNKVKKVLKEKASFFKKRILEAFPDFKVPTLKKRKK